MDTTFLNWPRGEIPEAYSPITWEDKRERTSRDYGPPERSNGTDVVFEDLERTDEYYQRDNAPY